MEPIELKIRRLKTMKIYFEGTTSFDGRTIITYTPEQYRIGSLDLPDREIVINDTSKQIESIEYNYKTGKGLIEI